MAALALASCPALALLALRRSRERRRNLRCESPAARGPCPGLACAETHPSPKGRRPRRQIQVRFSLGVPTQAVPLVAPTSPALRRHSAPSTASTPPPSAD